MTSYCPNGGPTQIGPGAAPPCPDSVCWHGTHVAGIATGNTGVLSANGGGVAPSANLIPIQAFVRDCSTGSCAVVAYDSDLMHALEYVLSLKTRPVSPIAVAAVNMSLGGSPFTTTCDSAAPAMTAVINSLRSAGVATVIASGNAGNSIAIDYPACISTAISVGSVNKLNVVNTFTNSANFLSLLAPGGAIVSSFPGGGFGGASGTSMATPHVAGAWALLKSAKPTATVSEVLLSLQNGGLPISDTRVVPPRIKPLIQLGYDGGNLNALGLLLGHGNLLPAVAMTSPANGASFVALANITLSANASDSDGSVTLVEFFHGSTKIGQVAAPGPYTLIWSGVPVGSYTLTARATDNLGGVSTSAPIAVNVVPSSDGSPPSVPTGLSASGVTESRVTLTWNASTDNVAVTGYKVFRNGVQVATPAGTTFTDIGLSASTTYSYTVSAFDAAGNNSAQSSPLAVTTGTPPPPRSGVVGWWRFEEGGGGVVADSSGNGNVGTLRNGPLWSTGQAGGGLQLDGATQDVQVGDSASLSVNGTGLTLAGWIFPSQAVHGGIIHKDNHFSLFRFADGRISYADSATWSYAAIGSYGATPLNTWSHVAVSFDGSVIRFYINGTLAGTVNRAGTLADNTSPLHLGSYAGTAYRFGGKLDELQVFNRALSAAEIAGLAGGGTPPDGSPPSVPTGLAASAISANSVTLTWNAATDNVAVTGYKVFRNGVQVGTPLGTSFADSGLSASTTYNYTVSAFDAAGNNSLQSAPPLAVTTTNGPPAGQVGHWRFEEGGGGVVADSSGNGNAGTLRNGPLWSTGQAGGGLQLDGATQDVQVSDSASLSVNGTGLTLAGWIFPTQASRASLIHKDVHFSLHRNADGSLTYADSATWNYAAIGSYGATPLNTWSHVAVSFDGSVIRFYVNGTLAGAVNRAGTLTDNTSPVYLGSYAGTAYRFGGKLDELQVFNRALSAAEIAGLAGGGAPPDGSPPSVPTGLAASAISANSVTLTWNASTDNVAVTGYKVFRNGVQVGTPLGTSFADSGLSASTTYNYTVSAFDAAGNDSAPSAPPLAVTTTNGPPPPPAGQVGHWRFEEGSGGVVADSSGNGNAGTLRNGPLWSTGQAGGGLQLDGATQDVQVSDSASLSVNGTGLTLAGWIFPTQASRASLIHKDVHFSLHRNADGSLTYADSATWNYAAIGNHGATPLNTWSHVAVSFDGSVIRFYVNGTLVGAVNRAGVLADNANPLYLGSYAGTRYNFGGKLDELQVFNRALSATEIAGLAGG